MSPAERQAMIETMVGRLAAKLEQDGSDLPGWLKLVRAYSVLDRKDDARESAAARQEPIQRQCAGHRSSSTSWRPSLD